MKKMKALVRNLLVSVTVFTSVYTTLMITYERITNSKRSPQPRITYIEDSANNEGVNKWNNDVNTRNDYVNNRNNDVNNRINTFGNNNVASRVVQTGTFGKENRIEKNNQALNSGQHMVKNDGKKEKNSITNNSTVGKFCKFCVNHTIYKSVISPPQSQDLVLLITTSHRNDAAERRDAIRSTWANDSYYLPRKIQHVFVCGLCKNCNLTALYREAEKYGDIVMFDFIDSYQNLTIKSLVTLDWAQKHYTTKYFFKVDDDMFVKLEVIMNIIQKYNHYERVMIGYCLRDSKPRRNLSNKYHISYEMYSGDVYPPVCFGTGYVISTQAIQSLLPYSEITPLTHLEDVSLAILAEKAGNVEVINVPGFRGDLYRKIHCPLSITQHALHAANITSAWRMCREKHVV